MLKLLYNYIKEEQKLRKADREIKSREEMIEILTIE